MINKRNFGFASMDQAHQREIASHGGRIAHEKGVAHEFTPEEAREAGRKGGRAISRDRAHMAAIGRLGAKAKAERNRNRMLQSFDPEAVFNRFREDHATIKGLIERIAYETGDRQAVCAKVFPELRKAIENHSQFDKHYLCSTLNRNPRLTEVARETLAQHDRMDRLVGRFDTAPPDEEGFQSLFNDLREEVMTHLEKEESSTFQLMREHLSLEEIQQLWQEIRSGSLAEADAAPPESPERSQSAA